MKNTGIIIWLSLLTLYIGYQEFGLLLSQEKQNSNLEIRKQKFENIDVRFKSLEKYLNERLNENLNGRFKNIETYINEVIIARFEHNEQYLHEH